MTNKEPHSIDQQIMQGLAAGRSVDDQTEWIQRWGNHAVPSILRASVLRSHGLAKYKKQAENVVFFGCYIPFSGHAYLKACLQVLDRLDIDYCCLEEESCCSAPILSQSSRENREKAEAAGRSIIRKNIDRAHQKGAARLAYCCVGCAHTTKSLFPEEADRHVYIHDLVMEKLEASTLRVPPATVGYFEGCHTLYKVQFPGVSLDWQRYRRLLDRIEGLNVVDLPSHTCCKKESAKILENAKEVNVDTLVCACNGCANFIGQATEGKIRVVSYPEMILKALG
jgi:Fe-S oxidoreductase